MKILVLNGSPQGNHSITLQTVLYIQKKFPENEWEYLNVGQKIHVIEKNAAEYLEKVQNADLLVVAYPVYTFLVPSQLHRFIELLHESGRDFSGKYAVQIATSKHFYDVTAFEFVKENLLDSGFFYLGGLSADMEDLLHEQGQQDAVSFWKHVMWRKEKNLFETMERKPQNPVHPVKSPVISNDQSVKKNSDKRVVVVGDIDGNDVVLTKMIECFAAELTYRCDVINLRDFSFAGGCLGCLHCVVSGHCVYRDGFEDFLRNNIQSADAIVYAFTISHHSMGSLFKMYDDRQFVNGHRTVTMGKPIGYIVNGALSQEENLRMMIEARSQTGGNYLAGIATNENNPNAATDRLVEELTYAIQNHFQQPAMFYGVGGSKIFRDLVYEMRGFMRADHKFYRENHLYDDLPDRKKSFSIAMYAVGAMMKNPKIQTAAFSKMSEGMLLPYRKVLEKMDSGKNKES